MAHKQPPRSRTQTTRRRAPKNRFTGLIVIAVLVVIMFLVALLLGNKEEKPQSSSTSIPISTANTPVSSVPEPPKEEVPPATGEYDVAGLPPLYNYENFIPDDYVLDLADIGSGHTMQAPAAAAYRDMVAAAAADGVILSPISGYRSHQHQTNNYNNKIQSYLAQGYSEAEAQLRTENYIAIPGTSEHEAGLAIDINSLEESFDTTPAFEWLQKHAAEYGFILRYRQETYDITHINYEPWHYRFVGANHAARIQQLGGITLEEYLALFD